MRDEFEVDFQPGRYVLQANRDGGFIMGLSNALLRRGQALRDRHVSRKRGSRGGAARVLHRAVMIEGLEGRQLFSTVFGVTSTNHLITFDSATPGVIANDIPLGVPAGENVVGIDVRPADGLLYAVTDASILYVVNTATGVMTQITPVAFTTPMNGTAYGDDFNPTNDTLRIISNADQDNEIDPTTGDDTGTPVSGVAYANNDVNFGANPNIVGLAYTNNFAGAPTTTLYGIDSRIGELVKIDPEPGIHTPAQINSVGPLGLTSTDLVGFDILSGGTNTAFASITPQARVSDFYTINLNTGLATLVGTIGNGTQTVVDIAMAPVTPGFSFMPSTYTVSQTAGSVTLTVTRSGSGAAAATVDFVTADNTAHAGANYVATAGTLTFAPFVFSQTITVPIINDNVHEGDTNFNVVLSNPTGANIDNATGTVTVIDTDAAAVFQFSPASYSVSEGAGSAQLIVTRTGSPLGTFTMNFATSDVTANFGTDYTPAIGTLTFGPGDTLKTINVPIINDSIHEPDETFNVTLSNLSGVGGQLGNGTGAATNTATVTIVDDDAPPAFSVSDPTPVFEGDTGQKAISFVVSLVGQTSATTFVNFQTSDGTAHSNSDYVATSGSLTFAPGGPTSQVVTVLINGDTRFEPDEFFTLNLFNNSGATIAKAQGRAVILNDDPGSVLQIDPGNPKQTVLTVVGSRGNDSLLISRVDSKHIEAILDGNSLGTFRNPGRLALYGMAGNDGIFVDPRVKIPAVILGGDGNDTLFGGASRDILIGGPGADKLNGRDSDDILIGGSTAFDTDAIALAKLSREWTSNKSYAKRIRDLTVGGGFNGSLVLTRATIIDDGFRDTLTGGNGQDFFPFATGDTITDGNKNENGVPTNQR
jgi:hypothetical protein